MDVTSHMETVRLKCPKTNTAECHEWEVMLGCSLDTVTESHTQLLLTLIPMHLKHRQVRFWYWHFSDCTMMRRNQRKNLCSKISSHKEPYNCSILSTTGNNTYWQKGKNHMYQKARTSGLITLMIKFLEHLVISLEGL